MKPDKSQYTPEVQALVDSANVARDEFNAANNAYNDLNYDIQVRFFKIYIDFWNDGCFLFVINIHDT